MRVQVRHVLQGSSVSIFGFWWALLFGKVIDLVGGEALLEEVCTNVGGRFGRIIALAHFLFSFCLLCVDEDVTIQLSAPATMPSLLVAVTFCHNELCPSGTVNQNKPFIPQLAFCLGILSLQQKSNNKHW